MGVEMSGVGDRGGEGCDGVFVVASTELTLRWN